MANRLSPLFTDQLYSSTNALILQLKLVCGCYVFRL
jgi:hypothetical protein